MRVLHLPRRHPYVQAVTPADVDVVAPPPEAGAWDLDPAWTRPAAVLADVDVVHVHFGYEALDASALTRWVADVRAARCALVVTVHDLRNPHEADPAPHAARLQVLVGAADAVLTLTPGAAAELLRRYGRAATVVPHPAVFDGPAAVGTTPGLVGVLLKPWRTNVVDPATTLRVVADAVTTAGGRLEVRLDGESPAIPEFSALLGDALVVAPRPDDDALRTLLTGWQVTVMLNRWGTHSGWVEAAHDTGTTVVAPSCGFYAEQWPAVVTYRHDEAVGLDAASLTRAVTTALRRPPSDPAGAGPRRQQRCAVQQQHREVYARCASGR